MAEFICWLIHNQDFQHKIGNWKNKQIFFKFWFQIWNQHEKTLQKHISPRHCYLTFFSDGMTSLWEGRRAGGIRTIIDHNRCKNWTLWPKFDGCRGIICWSTQKNKNSKSLLNSNNGIVHHLDYLKTHNIYKASSCSFEN